MTRYHGLALAFTGVLLSGCMVDPTTGSAHEEREGYDPGADIGVNPDSVFEPYPEDEPERVDRDAVLVRYALDEPTSLNPLYIRTWADGYMRELVFDDLVDRDNQLRARWNPRVVAGVEELEGGKVHRVSIHPGLRWHDGHPWTSHDVRFTWEAINDENVPAIDFKYKAIEILDIRVIDDTTFDVVHKEVSALRLDNLYIPIVPKHILDVAAEREADPTMQSSDYYNRYQRELGWSYPVSVDGLLLG